MKNVPELRFKEFRGTWKGKKLEDVAIVNPKTDILPENFVYIDLESVENGILNKKNHIDKNNAPSRAQRILEINDILYQTVRPYQKNNLFFNFCDNFYVSSTGYAQLRANEDPDFLFQIIHIEKFVNEVLKKCTGTSYPAINSSDLKKIKIKIPSIKEQEKIADFLSKVDEKIAILEDKLQLWNSYKKGIMQQLFSQNLRFKDDDGNSYPDWEEKKLGAIVEVKKGTQINKNEMVKNGGYYVLNGGVGPSGFTNEWNMSENTITISEGGNSCGYVNYNFEKFWCGGHCYSLNDIKESVNDLFLFQSLKFSERLIMRLRVGSGLPNIQKKDLLIFKLKLPSKLEQEKIANFLIDIDNKINEIFNDVEIQKEFKKGLLQKMFC